MKLVMMMRTGGKSKRRRKDRWTNRLAMIGITAVVISMAVVVNLKSASIRAKDLDYQMREQALSQQVEYETNRGEKLSEKEKYVNSYANIEKIAKEKLGLVKPDEILLKPDVKN